MAYEKIDHVAFVDSDGNYSGGVELVLFDTLALTPEQWEELDSLGDNSRLDYVYAVLEGQDTSKWVGY